MNWYPRYPGDYMRDTAHLSLTEHGAYNVLLDHYYATGGPLPDKHEALIRICRAYEDWEKQAVKSVADSYFPINCDGLRHNKRADKQLAEMQDKHQALSEAGKRGMAKRWKKAGRNKVNNHPSNHPSNQAITYPQPQPHPHTTAKTTTKKRSGKPDNLPIIESGFAEAWAAYPDKSGKAAARAAYQKAVKEGDAQPDILAGIARYRAYVESKRENGHDLQWRNGSTFFNQRGWQDEWAADPQKPVADSGRKTNAASKQLVNHYQDPVPDMAMRKAF